MTTPTQLLCSCYPLPSKTARVVISGCSQPCGSTQIVQWFICDNDKDGDRQVPHEQLASVIPDQATHDGDFVVMILTLSTGTAVGEPHCKISLLTVFPSHIPT